jgi:hypothetical protein
MRTLFLYPNSYTSEDGFAYEIPAEKGKRLPYGGLNLNSRKRGINPFPNVKNYFNFGVKNHLSKAFED